MKYVAKSDYEVIDRNPLALEVGDVVKVGKRDAAWSGWVWVSVADGRGSYVPEDVLADSGAQAGMDVEVVEGFAARDLSVKKGDVVEMVYEVKGWIWGRDTGGVEGWLPEYLLGRG